MQKQIIVQGKVQGVFFRAFVKENADKLGIKGYVRNLDDDKVEIVAEGDSVDKLIELCKEGPKAALVSQIAVTISSNKKFSDFSIRY